MNVKPIAHEDFTEWVKPFFDHIGLTVLHAIRMSIEPGPDGNQVRFTLVDTDDPECECPVWHRSRMAGRGPADEFTKALYEVVVPIEFRAEIDRDPVEKAREELYLAQCTVFGKETALADAERRATPERALDGRKFTVRPKGINA